MIYLNDNLITPKHFNDGALDIKIDVGIIKFGEKNVIKWLFDNNEELVTLYYLTKYLKSKGVKEIKLYMPYIPNARKDRAHRETDVFTLKYFAELINSLDFSRVIVLDPHSTVSEALIDRIYMLPPEDNILKVLEGLDPGTLMFYPDEGALKRYSDKIKRDYLYGAKSRDKTTREINSYNVFGETELVNGKDVLMVDDICASGKTLLKAAEKLKKLGAADIYVYVSHCENTVLESDLLNVIKMMFTTNSIYRGSHPKISVIE